MMNAGADLTRSSKGVLQEYHICT